MKIVHAEFSRHNIFLQSKFHHLFSLKLVSPVINPWIRSQTRHPPRDSTEHYSSKLILVRGGILMLVVQQIKDLLPPLPSVRRIG